MKAIDTTQLKQMMARGDVRVVNVLSEEDYQREHIPGSESVPLDTPKLASRIEELAGGKRAPVVVYCANRQCTASPTAARKLEDAGFTEVYDYEDGIEGWKQAGERVESGAPATR